MSRIQRTQGRDVTRLRIEPLEDRQMLAQYAFAMNLYQDAGGAPGDLITNDSVQVGDSFFVEITAEDLRAEPLGLRGLGLRIRWDPQAFEEIDTPFDPAASDSPLVTSKFPLYRGGDVDNANGVIEWLQGSAFLAMGAGDVIGVNGPERFALLHFRAEQLAQQSPLSMRVCGGVGFVPMRSYTSDD